MDIKTSLTTITLNTKEVEVLEKTAELLQTVGSLTYRNNVEIVDINSNDLETVVDSIYGGACRILEHYKIDEEE